MQAIRSYDSCHYGSGQHSDSQSHERFQGGLGAVAFIHNELELARDPIK